MRRQSLGQRKLSSILGELCRQQRAPVKPSMAMRPFHFSAKGVKGPTERESGFSPAQQRMCENPVSADAHITR